MTNNLQSSANKITVHSVPEARFNFSLTSSGQKKHVKDLLHRLKVSELIEYSELDTAHIQGKKFTERLRYVCDCVQRSDYFMNISCTASEFHE